MNKIKQIRAGLKLIAGHFGYDHTFIWASNKAIHCGPADSEELKTYPLPPYHHERLLHVYGWEAEPDGWYIDTL